LLVYGVDGYERDRNGAQKQEKDLKRGKCKIREMKELPL